jgi:hypothetical protein
LLTGCATLTLFASGPDPVDASVRRYDDDARSPREYLGSLLLQAVTLI